MKSREEAFYEALQSAGVCPSWQTWEMLGDGDQRQHKQAAAAYDKAVAADLPDDVEAFVREVERRWHKATPGPIDVHRIDQHDGTIAYQLQQADDAPRAKTDSNTIGGRVLTQYDDLDNPDARHDAEFHAKAHVDTPRFVAIVRAQADANAKMRDAWLLASNAAAETVKETAALRDRLAKLEALLVRTRKHWGPDASNEGCECVGCTIIRDIDAELLNEKGGA